MPRLLGLVPHQKLIVEEHNIKVGAALTHRLQRVTRDYYDWRVGLEVWDNVFREITGYLWWKSWALCVTGEIVRFIPTSKNWWWGQHSPIRLVLTLRFQMPSKPSLMSLLELLSVYWIDASTRRDTIENNILYPLQILRDYFNVEFCNAHYI